MVMSSAAASQPEVPNGDLPRWYIVDKSSLCVYQLLNTSECHV